MAFTLEGGAAAPDFRLPGVDGKDGSLADVAEAGVPAQGGSHGPLPRQGRGGRHENTLEWRREP
jgi:hypothetical protein